MNSSNKLTIEEKEEKILKRLENAKQALHRLKEKRKQEIGLLACKYGLDKVDNTILEQVFEKLSKELIHGNH